MTLKHRGVTLPYGKFDKDQRVRQADVVDKKHLGAALAFAQRLQEERDAKLVTSRALTMREKKRVRMRQAKAARRSDAHAHADAEATTPSSEQADPLS